VLAALAGMSPTARAQGGVAPALSWLRGQQAAEGGWAGDVRLLYRDTPEVVRVLLDHTPGDAAPGRAVDHLLTAAPSIVVDLEARRLILLRARLSETLYQASLETLAAAAAPDSGWGFPSCARTRSPKARVVSAA